YNATRFFQMLSEKGARATAKILLAGDENKVSDGFTAMWERGRLDLTVEAICSHRQYRPLFTEQELETARKRLDKARQRGASPERIQEPRRAVPATNKAQARKPDERLRVFLCHSSADKLSVRTLYKRLKNDGFAPWLDKEELLPGQNWREEIPRAVRSSHVVIVCLSKEFQKAGYRQKEVLLALDVADEQPEGTIFLIPLKLEECDIPSRLDQLHWAGLFDDDGYRRLVLALKTRSKELGIPVTSPHLVTDPHVQAAPPAETFHSQPVKSYRSSTANRFDDFAQKHVNELENKKRVAKETESEWDFLKNLLSRFALDGRGIDSYKFEWVPDLSGYPSLVLNNVSAILFDRGGLDGVAQSYRVRFSRKPAGPGRAYVDGESRVPEKSWSIEPDISNGKFVWFVYERGRRWASAEVAQEIATELAQYHIRFEKAYGRE
ncbi:MAG: toll/interleukin-1 receptor domain-containing protein, partial [Candidatus Angelobacter sp.]